MTALPQDDMDLMTVAEFRAWPGDGSGRRFDLVNGRIRAQSTHSQTHGMLQTRLLTVLTNHLDTLEGACRAVPAASIVPEVLSNWNELHPDVAVTCEPNDPAVHELRKPILIIEVLSDSNRGETWDNVAKYATISTVREILVLEQDVVAGYYYTRQADGAWPADVEEIGPDDTLTLRSFDLAIPMHSLYRGTNVDPAKRPRRRRTLTR
jgi:Uma2 family endonuclease